MARPIPPPSLSYRYRFLFRNLAPVLIQFIHRLEQKFHFDSILTSLPSMVAKSLSDSLIESPNEFFPGFISIEIEFFLLLLLLLSLLDFFNSQLEELISFLI